MTAEIKANADFFRHLAYPARENCEKCDFQMHKLCLPTIEGIIEHCSFGQRGYWAFKGGIKGKVE